MKKTFRRILSAVLIAVMLFCCIPMSALAKTSKAKYTVPKELMSVMKEIPRKYHFAVGWGLYDISGDGPKEVASRHANILYSSNCTIKAPLLMYICRLMDEGKLSLTDELYVEQAKIRRKDFPKADGYYPLDYLLERMITVSNSACYEVVLHKVGLTNFNRFLHSLGSGTTLTSYSYKGDCTVANRAKEWYAIYKYCHSGAKHASYAWKLFCNAWYSPIRDGIGRPAAHKSGWYRSDIVPGTAADCAVVSTPNGGCYLLVVLTRSNVSGEYSPELISDMAVAADKIWDNYYAAQTDKPYAKF